MAAFNLWRSREWSEYKKNGIEECLLKHTSLRETSKIHKLTDLLKTFELRLTAKTHEYVLYLCITNEVYTLSASTAFLSSM